MRTDAATGPDRRPNYLFFSSWPVRAGTGVNNVIVGLSAAMQKDFSPQIVVTGWKAPPDGQFWVKMPAPSLPIRNLLGFARYLFPNLVRLFRLTRGAAAVNPHYFGAEILPLAILRKAKLVPRLILSVHGADVSDALKASRFERGIYAWLCRNADAVIACSASLTSEVTRISPGARVMPIWNGISSPPAVFGARPLASPYLVSVASFVRKKGHDVLLRAFQQVAATRPDLQLVLIGGEGPERKRIEDLITELNLNDRIEIRINMPHDDVWTWVRHAECFVHASREEPFGIAILEAALVHTPVVTTSVGGIPEYLTNGLHGLTCEPDKPDCLAEAVLLTLNDPAAAIARANAFYEQAQKFTWDAAWAKYREVSGLEGRSG